MEKVDYLPLGSIVYLKNGTKKVIIVGRGLLLKNGDEQLYFDYGGVPYPEGLVDDQMAYFQHENINKIVFKGFTDFDDEAIVDRINSYLEKKENLKRGNVDEMIKEN